jgi:putative holliday junction resolvase
LIRILGLDVGTVRIGVALSDPLGMTAQPLEVIDRRRTDAVARIAALCTEYEVQRVIYGRPLRLDGSAGAAVEMVDKFIAELAPRLSVPQEPWDERLSTAQAERAMLEGGARREQRRERVDKIAAALILQSYLDARGSQP